jgi:hypothetical protein
VIDSEIRAYHKILRYAGTADLLCVLNGKVTIVDVKTSASIIEMLVRVQLSAYQKMLDSHGFKVEGKAILHLGKSGEYTMEHFPVGDAESWECFCGCLTISNYIKKYAGR